MTRRPPPVDARSSRRVGRVSSAASGRALLGAALVVAAVLALYVAWVRATSGGTLTVLVAARPLDPGHAITDGDLRAVQLRAAGDELRGVFSDPAVLIGATTLGPIGEGELVQAAALVKKAAGPQSMEIGLSLDLDEAVGGVLRAGDLVDVYETDVDRAVDRPRARLLASGVPVVWTRGVDLSGSSSIDLIVGVGDRETASAVVAAAAQDQVALVRSTGVAPAGAPLDPGGSTGSVDPTVGAGS